MLLYCFYFSPDSFQKGYENERVMRTIRWTVGIRGDKEGEGEAQGGTEEIRERGGVVWGHGVGKQPIPL